MTNLCGQVSPTRISVPGITLTHNSCISLLGYLMAANRQHSHPSTYACVDKSPEHIPNSSGDTDGSLFYFVQGDCLGEGTFGSAHCPPYYNTRELTCVVCSI